MIIVNTNTIEGKNITKTLGLVRGNTVSMAGLRNLIGGEIKKYTEMLTEAREEAISRMIAEAEKLEADAVINVRFETSQLTSSASEILSYGTAVKTEK